MRTTPQAPGGPGAPIGNGFTVDTDLQASQSQNVMDHHDSLVAEVNGLMDRLEGVTWDGPAAQAFADAKAAWQLAAGPLHKALSDIADGLRLSGHLYDGTDSGNRDRITSVTRQLSL